MTPYQKNPDSYRRTLLSEEVYNQPGLGLAQFEMPIFEKVLDLSVTKIRTQWFQSGTGLTGLCRSSGKGGTQEKET